MVFLIIFWLHYNGYSFEQIIEGVLLGQVSFDHKSERCYGFILRDADGKRITPYENRPPPGFLVPGNTSAHASTSLPFTFIGERKVEIDATAEFGSQGTNSCSGKGSIWISILENGLVVGEIEYIHFDLSWDEDGNATRCESSNKETTSFTGTHTSGSFNFSTEWNANYTGVYTSQSIDGGAGKTDMLDLGSGHTADYFIKSSFIIDRAY